MSSVWLLTRLLQTYKRVEKPHTDPEPAAREQQYPEGELTQMFLRK